ncbi:fructokinase [Enterococcus florum]|uniref:Fructokinase n=1 Tax=Enterococcus florum TaxID=2480627 RepID=A0A4P5P7X7_9ENTE|nr:ROK family protein [Enterococcus florum]GCF94077.1 fructokinase [Enterococcus florum]
MLVGGIEAGGTKFVCAVANEQLEMIEKISFPTVSPEETLKQVFAFFDQYHVAAIGIGSFGPIGVRPDQPKYGYVLSTPKKGWENFDVLGTLKSRYSIPMYWTTDVNTAAYGELKMGAAQGCSSCIYVTVGTGIGGGIIVDRQIFQGISHPEMGHFFVKRHPEDTYKGCCPYHQDCLEGLASGPSLEARTGIKGEQLTADDPIWELQAYYLAQALVAYTVIVGPEKIVLGGGVMNQDHLLQKIRRHFLKAINGYVQVPSVEEYIVRWELPNESGLIGALLLAMELTNQ